MRKLHIQTVYI